MTDKIKLVGDSLLHYGKENDRVYLMKLAKEDYPGIVKYMDDLALNDGYSKIIAKIPVSLKDLFLKNGYEQEAIVQNFYNGKEDALFLAKYFSKERKNFTNRNEILNITQFCLEKGPITELPNLDEKFSIKSLNKKHVSQITNVFTKVFKNYPFPVFENDYVLQTMDNNVDYFGAFFEKKLVAVSSSEMDLKNSNTEMTDFATLPEYRGNSLALHLLAKMEKAARKKSLKTAYTIARGKAVGMNMTFTKSEYEFGGTLVKNTNICDSIEAMNVWYKSLQNTES